MLKRNVCGPTPYIKILPCFMVKSLPHSVDYHYVGTKIVSTMTIYLCTAGIHAHRYLYISRLTIWIFCIQSVWSLSLPRQVIITTVIRHPIVSNPHNLVLLIHNTCSHLGIKDSGKYIMELSTGLPLIFSSLVRQQAIRL